MPVDPSREPGFVVRPLPMLCVSAGIFALLYFSSLLGTVSALLLIGAGMLDVFGHGSSSRGRKSGKRQQSRSAVHRSGARTAGAGKRRDPRARPRGTARHAPGRDPAVELTRRIATGSGGEGTRLVTGSRVGSNAAFVERRQEVADRRGWQPMPLPPFVDSDGTLVRRDRRHIPDRRRASIVVEDITDAPPGDTDTKSAFDDS